MVYVFKLKNYKNKLKMNNCKIVLVASKQTFVFADKLPLEQALPLALNIHRTSNVAHHIDVFEDERQVCSLVSSSEDVFK